MNSYYQEETKRSRKSLNSSENEDEVPRKRSKSSLNTEQIISIYDLVEELQDKEEKFYNGIQRQVEVFHIAQQGRYKELKRDIYNIKRRLSGEEISKPKYQASRRESFSTDTSSLKSNFSCTESPEPQPEMERSNSPEKVRSPMRNSNKRRSPFSSARVALPPPLSPSPTSSPPPPPPPPQLSSSPPPPPSPSLQSPSPPPPPLPPQSERARRNLPKQNYEPKLSIEGDDEFILPPPKYDNSDGEFVPGSSRPDPDDDEPSPSNPPTNHAKKGKSKPRKSSIKGQRKESSKALGLLSKSIGTPGIAKKETHQSNLLGYWTKGAEDGESRKTASSKRSATISRPSPSPSPSLSPPPPPTSPPPPPPPSPPSPPLLNPVARWRVEKSRT